MLLRLDELLAEAPGVTYEHARITVEHVLPQNPAPTSLWKVRFTDEPREYWTHRIANLVLLNRTKNSQARKLRLHKEEVRLLRRKERRRRVRADEPDPPSTPADARGS